MIKQTLIVILFVQVLITLVELVLNFKAKSQLKTIFVLLLVATGWFLIARFMTDYGLFNRTLTYMPGSLIFVCILFLLGFLYQYKISKNILVMGITLLVVHWGVLIYFWLGLHIPNQIDLTKITLFREFFTAARLITSLLFLGYAIYLLVKIHKKYPSHNRYFKQLKLWSLKFPIIIALFCLCNLFQSITIAGFLNMYLIFITFLTLILLILFRPRFLNHLSLEFTLINTTTQSVFTINKVDFIERFLGESYYLNPLASLEDMAIKLGVSTTDLYNFIYHNYTLSFNDLLNKHRVDYFIDLVQSRKYPHYTIDALAQLSGFSSRHHLYKPFQKFHGGTPSGFMNSIA